MPDDCLLQHLLTTMDVFDKTTSCISSCLRPCSSESGLWPLGHVDLETCHRRARFIQHLRSLPTLHSQQPHHRFLLWPFFKFARYSEATGILFLFHDFQTWFVEPRPAIGVPSRSSSRLGSPVVFLLLCHRLSRSCSVAFHQLQPLHVQRIGSIL